MLAAGAGTRLRPLTELLPKALCPVNNRPLVDWAIDRVRGVVDEVAVNAHHHLDAMLEHLAGRQVHVSVEAEQALGTAGGLGRLRDWIDGRGALVLNADAWSRDNLARLIEGWDGERVRLLVSYDPGHPDFDGLWRFAGASLMPWTEVQRLNETPSGLFEMSWRKALQEQRLDFMTTQSAYVDCGTPRDYLAANLLASGGRTVVGAGALIRGRAEHSVVWAQAVVQKAEHLRYVVLLPDGTAVPCV